MKHAARVTAWLLVGLAALGGCKTHKAGSRQDYFVAEPLKLMLPKASGWVQDTSLATADPKKGGIVLRLVRESAVPGSPRIDVVLAPAGGGTNSVEDFLTRNLQEMGKMEASGQIHINQVEQRRVAVGLHTAYRVRHEYTIGSGTGQAAINQVSTFVVLGGRGVAVTAAGRTELYHPLADSIEAVLDGLRLQDEAAPQPGGGVEPIDLGKVGGKK